MISTLESNIFQNQQVPQSIIVLTKIMPDISESALNSVLKMVLETLQKKSPPPKSLEKLFRKLEITENGDHLFSGLLMLLRAILRLPPDYLKENDLRQILKDLKFSEECCNEFLISLKKNENNMYFSEAKLVCNYFSKLETFNWRIDISISSNFIAKSLDTMIIFQLILNNEESKTFEVSIAKFHQLRFYVSCMLKELEFIEKKSCHVLIYVLNYNELKKLSTSANFSYKDIHAAFCNSDVIILKAELRNVPRNIPKRVTFSKVTRKKKQLRRKLLYS